MINQQKKVIIRIWHSALNVKNQGENVGHVSIETIWPKRLISLWPTSVGKQTGFGIKSPINHEFKEKYIDDLKAEKRPPETTICLYSLNTDAIISEFDKIKSKIKGWTLARSGMLIQKRNKPEDAHSCASLALFLLKKGGIDNLIGGFSRSTFGVQFSSSVAPDSMAMLVRQAKKAELQKYPLTKNFKHPGETQVNDASCLIL